MSRTKRFFKSTVEPYSVPDPGRRERTFDYWFTIAVMFSLSIFVVLTTISLYVDFRARPLVDIPMSEWNVTFQVPSSDCPTDEIAKTTCPGHPQNEQLWSSVLRLDSPRFLERYENGSGSEAYWIGIKVPRERLIKASRSSATTLVLPRFGGVAQVWVDGVHQATHDHGKLRLPLQVALTKARMDMPTELVVIIGIFPFPHEPLPESTGEVRAGFYSLEGVDHLTRSEVFFSTTRQLIASGLFLLVAVLLWTVSGASRTRDYAVGTQLALLASFVSLLSVDLSSRFLDVSTFESLYFTLLALEGILVTRFTWTILRGSRETKRIEAVLISSVLLATYFLIPANWIEETGAHFATFILLPVVYVCCSMAILFRFSRLKARGVLASGLRMEFLVVSGVAMGIAGLVYFVEAAEASGFNLMWGRSFNLISLFALVRVFVKSHRTKASLIELSPASKYHAMSSPPDRVEGWIVYLEILKFSRDRQVIGTILSHLWTIAQLHDGVVVKADDRSLVLMFEKASDGSERVRMADMISQMHKCVKDLERRLPIMFPAGRYSTSILFRASIVAGALKPDWQRSETGLSRIPVWLETSEAPSIDDAKRLMTVDVDAELRSNDVSIVVMKAEDGGIFATKHTSISEDGVGNVVVFLASRLKPSLSSASRSA